MVLAKPPSKKSKKSPKPEEPPPSDWHNLHGRARKKHREAREVKADEGDMATAKLFNAYGARGLDCVRWALWGPGGRRMWLCLLHTNAADPEHGHTYVAQIEFNKLTGLELHPSVCDPATRAGGAVRLRLPPGGQTLTVLRSGSNAGFEPNSGVLSAVALSYGFSRALATENVTAEDHHVFQLTQKQIEAQEADLAAEEADDAERQVQIQLELAATKAAEEEAQRMAEEERAAELERLEAERLRLEAEAAATLRRHQERLMELQRLRELEIAAKEAELVEKHAAEEAAWLEAAKARAAQLAAEQAARLAEENERRRLAQEAEEAEMRRAVEEAEARQAAEEAAKKAEEVAAARRGAGQKSDNDGQLDAAWTIERRKKAAVRLRPVIRRGGRSLLSHFGQLANKAGCTVLRAGCGAICPGGPRR